MPKGDTHVKKHNKGDKRRFNFNSNDLKVPDKDQGEMIGEIIGTLGSCRFNVKIFDENIEVQATALRSFQKGPRKEVILTKDYVVVQPGISKGQYFINHKYNQTEVEKLYGYGIIGKPKKSTIVEQIDVIEFEETVPELSLDDIWDI
jgi:hypothetical protein